MYGSPHTRTFGKTTLDSWGVSLYPAAVHEHAFGVILVAETARVVAASIKENAFSGVAHSSLSGPFQWP